MIAVLLCVTSAMLQLTTQDTARVPPNPPLRARSDWESKLPPFAKVKPVVRTNELWKSQQWQIWIGFTCFLEDYGPRFTGIRPTIAGTTRSWDGEYDYSHVGEYVTLSGQSVWFLLGEGKRICTGRVPLSEPPSLVRLYSGDGTLLKTFIPEQGVVVPGWAPALGQGATLQFTQTKGGAPETWKSNHTVAAYMRASGDGGTAWTNFGGWIDPDQPSQSIPAAFLTKPEILVDVFSTYGLNFEITRYRLTPGTPGGSPVIVPFSKKSVGSSFPKK